MVKGLSLMGLPQWRQGISVPRAEAGISYRVRRCPMQPYGGQQNQNGALNTYEPMGCAGYDAITEIVLKKIPSPQDFITNNLLWSTETADKRR